MDVGSMNTILSDLEVIKNMIVNFLPKYQKSPETKAALSRLIRSTDKLILSNPLTDTVQLKQDALRTKKLFKDFMHRPSESCREDLLKTLHSMTEFVTENSLATITDSEVKKESMVRSHTAPEGSFQSVFGSSTSTLDLSTKAESVREMAKNIFERQRYIRAKQKGHGVSQRDKLLASRDKNAVEFAFEYAKNWENYCKEVVCLLEKRATYETEYVHGLSKQFHSFELATVTMTGVPLRSNILSWSQQVSEHCKEVEQCNTKRCRELLEVLNRQHTEFLRTRRFLRDKWKAEVKRMIEAESQVQKTKMAYQQRCNDTHRLKRDVSTAGNSSHIDHHGHHLAPSPAVSMDNLGPVLGVSLGSASTRFAGSAGVRISESMPASPTDMKSSQLEVSPGNQGNTVNSDGKCHHAYSTNAVNLAGANEYSPPGANGTSGSGHGGFHLSSSSSNSPSAITNSSGGGSGAGNVVSGLTAASAQFTKQIRQSRADRNERLLADSEKKEADLMLAYREAVDNANVRLDELEKVKVEVLCDIRLTTMKSDEVFKDTLAEYFEIFVSARTPLMEQSTKLADTVKDYRPGREYQELIEHHVENFPDKIPDRYVLETFFESTDALTSTPVSSKESISPFLRARSISLKVRPWSSTAEKLDTSFTSIRSGRPSSYKDGSTTTLNITKRERAFGVRGNRNITTQDLSWSLGNAPDRDNSPDELEKARALVQRCIQAIEAQPTGILTHGIYRVPVSKNRVTSLIDALTISPDGVDLRSETPLTLASVLKNVLISLPEPLLTYDSYANFVEIGKAAQKTDPKTTADSLMKVVNSLPETNVDFARLLFHHLKRVSEKQSENEMGSVNLATMFGPTLLRPRNKLRQGNLQEFTDNHAQIKSVELMIESAYRLFGGSTTTPDCSSPQVTNVLPSVREGPSGTTTEEVQLLRTVGNTTDRSRTGAVPAGEKMGRMSVDALSTSLVHPRKIDDLLLRRRAQSVLDYTSRKIEEDSSVLNLDQYSYIDAESTAGRRVSAPGMPCYKPMVHTISDPGNAGTSDTLSNTTISSSSEIDSLSTGNLSRGLSLDDYSSLEDHGHIFAITTSAALLSQQPSQQSLLSACSSPLPVESTNHGDISATSSQYSEPATDWRRISIALPQSIEEQDDELVEPLPVSSSPASFTTLPRVKLRKSEQNLTERPLSLVTLEPGARKPLYIPKCRHSVATTRDLHHSPPIKVNNSAGNRSSLNSIDSTLSERVFRGLRPRSSKPEFV